MQIHLSKPGGHREGPFTVDQINRDLASHRYNDSDYWAWYEGLDSWIPLHSVPGIKAQPVADATEFISAPIEEQYSAPSNDLPENCEFSEESQSSLEAEFDPAPVDQFQETQFIPNDSFAGVESEAALSESVTHPESDAPAEPDSSPQSEVSFAAETFEQPVALEPAPAPAVDESADPGAVEPNTEMVGAAAVSQSKVFSGLSVDALEHIFVFTSGEGPAIRESSVAAMMMLEIIGENPDAIRQQVPRDVFGLCKIPQRIRTENKIPGGAWRAMSSLRPELVQRAKEGAYRTCVRTFNTEGEDVVAVFLFYNKERL